MESADGSARTVSLFAIAGNHQRRTAVAFDYASRRDSDDSAMPAVTVDHQAEGIQQRGLLFEARIDGFDNSAFFGLAIGVELIELVCDLASARRVFHAEEFDHVAGNIHAAGGVNSWRYAKSNFTRGEWSANDLCDFEQSLEPGIYG